jgi:hypothetical protein
MVDNSCVFIKGVYYGAGRLTLNYLLKFNDADKCWNQQPSALRVVVDSELAEMPYSEH